MTTSFKDSAYTVYGTDADRAAITSWTGQPVQFFCTDTQVLWLWNGTKWTPVMSGQTGVSVGWVKAGEYVADGTLSTTPVFNIPQTGRHLKVEINARATGSTAAISPATTYVRMRINGNTSGHQTNSSGVDNTTVVSMNVAGTSLGGVLCCAPNATAQSQYWGEADVLISDYQGSKAHSVLFTNSWSDWTGSSGTQHARTGCMLHDGNANPVTTLDFSIDTGNFASGSVITVYVSDVPANAQTFATNYRARAHGGTVSMPTAQTWYNVASYTTDEDPSSSFNASTGTFTAPVTGPYLLIGQIHAGTSVRYALQWLWNSTALPMNGYTTQSTDNPRYQSTSYVYATAGDTFKLQALADTNSASVSDSGIDVIFLGTASNPMSGLGDMIGGGTNGGLTRIPAGTTDQALFSQGTSAVPQWAAVAKMLGQAGDTFGTGTAPAATTGPFYMQAGTTVFGSGTSGVLTFPSAFPNGLLTVIAVNGDSTANSSAVSLRNIGGDTSKSKCTFTWPNSGAIRINWIAIGF